MKAFKTKLLGIEIKVHNKREDTLVSITRNNALNVLEWLDDETSSEVINSCDMEKRHKIAINIANEVNDLFTSMYYLSMIKEPICINVDDISSWNGVD